jgi:hypothetical protein
MFIRIYYRDISYRKTKKKLKKKQLCDLSGSYTVFLSNLSHQRDSTVPHRTETLLFKNAVTFKRDVFDPPRHATFTPTVTVITTAC